MSANYLFFWDHQPGASLGKECLTQWRGLNLLGFALGDVRNVLAHRTA